MKAVRCDTCGIVVPVRPGSRRLCGCGAWLSAEADAPDVVVDPGEADLQAVERLTAGCKRLLAECAKVIVGR